MPKANSNLLNLKKDYLFNEIEKKILLKKVFLKKKENKKILNLGIGDITHPIASPIIDAMKSAIDELRDKKTLKGYGPSDGYTFLKQKILDNDYQNLDIDIDEIFISNGMKYSISNISDLFSLKSTIGIINPAYPVYVDSNIMGGRKNQIVDISLIEKNNFEPKIPNEKLDLIYLCSPNNPTGIAFTKKTLKSWIDYANQNRSLIIFDGAYEAFIRSKHIAKSIYEIDGAKNVAIEMRSFSKNAGFTSLRCSYLIIPKNLKTHENLSINEMWKRYVDTKHGGISYPIQKAAAATYSQKAIVEIKNTIDSYMKGAKFLYENLKNLNFECFGGQDSPYIWCKCPDNLSSIKFFDLLLDKNIVCIPGLGFGKFGEGFVRFSAFASFETINEAINQLKNI